MRAGSFGFSWWRRPPHTRLGFLFLVRPLFAHLPTFFSYFRNGVWQLYIGMRYSAFLVVYENNTIDHIIRGGPNQFCSQAIATIWFWFSRLFHSSILAHNKVFFLHNHAGRSRHFWLQERRQKKIKYIARIEKKKKKGEQRRKRTACRTRRLARLFVHTVKKIPMTGCTFVVRASIGRLAYS